MPNVTDKAEAPEYRLAVQCVYEPTGATGCFIREAGGDPVTPLFPDLTVMLPWMREFGWELDERVNGEFIPWRVSNAAPWLPGAWYPITGSFPQIV